MRTLVEDRRAPTNVTVLTAATADQVAGPLPGAARPAFSYLVLGGLRGWADSDHNGRVTAGETVVTPETLQVNILVLVLWTITSLLVAITVLARPRVLR